MEPTREPGLATILCAAQAIMYAPEAPMPRMLATTCFSSAIFDTLRYSRSDAGTPPPGESISRTNALVVRSFRILEKIRS